MDGCKGRVTDSRCEHWMDEGVGEQRVAVGPSYVCGCSAWKRGLEFGEGWQSNNEGAIVLCTMLHVVPAPLSLILPGPRDMVEAYLVWRGLVL